MPPTQSSPEDQPQPETGRLRQLARSFAGHISTMDLNPHEGRLRGSVMPAEYMHIPDHPPLHDDTIPDSTELPPEDTPEADES